MIFPVGNFSCRKSKQKKASCSTIISPNTWCWLVARYCYRYKKFCQSNYYYYLVACWRPTTCPCQMPLSLISVASSAASRAPVSLFRVSTYVALGLPRPLRPWLGSHSTRGCALSSGWRMQWPASCSLLAAIVLLT